MLIITQDEAVLLDTKFISTVFLNINKYDDVPIYAKLTDDEKPHKLGRYSDREEAKGIILQIAHAIEDGESLFCMPLSRVFAPETEIHDARQRRKGGS